MKPTSLDVRCRSPKRLYHHCTRHVRFQRHWKVLKRLKRCLEPHFSRYVSAGAGFIVVSLGETLLTLLHSFQIPYLLNSAVFRKSLLSDFVLTCICTCESQQGHHLYAWPSHQTCILQDRSGLLPESSKSRGFVLSAFGWSQALILWSHVEWRGVTWLGVGRESTFWNL